MTTPEFRPPGLDAPPTPGKKELKELAASMGHIAEQAARLPEPYLREFNKVLIQAQVELSHTLERWLLNAKDGDLRYTAQKLRVAMLQINRSIEVIGAKLSIEMEGTLRAASQRAGIVSWDHLHQEVARFATVFGETTRPLQIRQAAIAAQAEHQLIPRFRNSAHRYGKNVEGDALAHMELIRREISVGILKGETIHEMTNRLVAFGGPRGWVSLRGVAGEPGSLVELIPEGLFKRYRPWAARVVRTETIHAYNVHHQEGLEAANEEDPGYQKRWDATVDHVCPLCKELDGYIVELHQNFPIFDRPHPPGHPNCRCALTPWRKEWDTPGPTSAPALAPPKKREKKAKTPSDELGPEALKDAKGPAGKALALDSDFIENQSVNVRQLSNAQGDSYYEFQFKVPMHREAAGHQWMSRTGSETDWVYNERSAAGGKLKDKHGRQAIGRSWQANLGGEPIEGGGQVANYVVDYGKTGAVRNLVRIRALTDKPAEALAAFEQVAKNIGIKKPLATPKEADVETMKKAKIVSKFRPDLMAPHLGSLNAERIGELFETVAKEHPVAKKILADAEVRETFDGHKSLYSKSLAQHLIEEGGLKGFYHDSSADDDVIVAMLKNGALASSARYDRGVFTTGMSTGTDFKTGGADGFFTRVAKDRSTLESSGYGVRFQISPEEAGRLDWWAFNHDQFGAAGPHQFPDRWSVPSMVSDRPRSHNEVMFQKGIKPSAITGLTAGSTQRRDKLLAACKKAGITEINGKPIEDFIWAR